MAEYSNNTLQTVVAGGNAVFSNEPSPCRRGYIIHRDDSGIFTVRGIVNNPCASYAKYVVDVGGNIAVATGGTPGEISMALAIDGEPLPTSMMTVTPAAVGEFFNIHSSIEIAVPSGCCYVVALENITSQPIDVQNLNIRFTRVA